VHPYCWLSDFFNAGGGAYVDVVDFHGYPGAGANPAVITTIANEIVSTLSSRSLGTLPMFDTESSQCSSSTTASFIGQFEILHVFSPVSRHYWYAWDDSACGPLWSPSGGLNPGGVAYSNVYQWMVGSTKTQSACSISGTVYTCGLTLANGAAALAVWNTAGSSSYTPAAQFKQYKDLQGNVYAVSGAVTIGQTPFLFTGSSTTSTTVSPPTGLTAIVN
jgi:hypothetical protein